MSTDETEVRAKANGWVPQEKFDGPASSWIDAKTYVERMDSIFPILRANNRKQTAEITNLRGEVQTLKQSVEESQKAVAELKEVNTEATRAAARAAQEQILSRLREARASGDTDAEVRLIDELTDSKAALKTATVAAKTQPATTTTPQLTAATQSWVAANKDWFGVNKRKTGLATGISEEMKAEGMQFGTPEFHEELDRRLADAEPNAARGRPSKVESGSGGGASGGAAKKSYGDLPADAREACDRTAKNITIGKGKTFETVDAYRQYYASKYDWT